MNKLSLLLILLLFTGCSHVGTLAIAQKNQSSAITKNDAAWKALVTKTADYNRELKLVVNLPWNVQTQFAADSLVDLQYQLTGNAALSEADLLKEANVFLMADETSLKEIKRQTADNKELQDTLSKTVIQRDLAIAKVTALAQADATLADKYDTLWNIVYVLIALGVVSLILWVLIKFGILAAKVAA